VRFNLTHNPGAYRLVLGWDIVRIQMAASVAFTIRVTSQLISYSPEQAITIWCNCAYGCTVKHPLLVNGQGSNQLCFASRHFHAVDVVNAVCAEWDEKYRAETHELV
jgi:hypothetical protein